ncbi:MAG TPA: winged helix-turn-helix domain-containing protein [Syntrophomonadaceae bacterium]|nr:winged helix-turn-helix domain-containing protein [Syntrophomonadaceae bacterium]
MDTEPKHISLGDVCFLDENTQELVKDLNPIPLSTIQYRLLHYLALHLKGAVTGDELITYAWGEGAYISRDILYSEINILRKYLESDPKNPEILISLRGLGYMLFPRKK